MSVKKQLHYMNINSAIHGTYVGSFVNFFHFTLNAVNCLYIGSYDKSVPVLN